MILIVRSTFDKSGANVLEKLESSCIDTLIKNNTASEIIAVPGAVEIPITIQHFLKKNPGKYSSVIALGCVIKGESDHYDLVLKTATEGLTRVALDFNIPVIHGILACHNTKQAIDRANLGAEFAETALEMQKTLS